jgi:putative Holliday junction resolvase
LYLVGIDVGTHRIGIAISDPEKKIAFPAESIERENNSYGFKKLKRLIGDKVVDAFVVGVPYREDGTFGVQGERVLAYIESLKEYFHIEVIPWDERYTTVIAEKVLISNNTRRVKRKQVVDKLAAQQILQSYLDHINSR